MLDVAEPDIGALIAAARDPGKLGEIAACATIVSNCPVPMPDPNRAGMLCLL